MPKFRKKPVEIEAVQHTGDSEFSKEFVEFLDRCMKKFPNSKIRIEQSREYSRNPDGSFDFSAETIFAFMFYKNTKYVNTVLFCFVLLESLSEDLLKHLMYKNLNSLFL